MRTRTVWMAVGIAALSAGAAFAERGVSERYAFETYRERTDGVTVLVDSYPASLRADEAYIPLHVAVGLRTRGPEVTVSRETFTLIDAAGNRVPAAGSMEIRHNYDLANFDRSVMRVRPLVVGQQFETSRQVRSNFYADGRGGVGVVQDRVHLSPFSWFHDVIYFPRPPAGLGGVLTLRVDGGGLEAPVEVHFKVLKDNVRRGL